MTGRDVFKGKEPTEPVAWADILAVEDTLTLDNMRMAALPTSR